MEIERFAQLMVNLEGLTGEQRREAKARLEVLEAHADSERLIRERLGTPVGCPHCAGTEVVRFGHANGRQRYRCKSCGRTFVALTGTPLMRLREPDKLLAYAACMSEGMTIRASAREVGLTLDRSFRWRHKFLSWIADQKPQGLTGLVEADETFFPKSYKGQRQEMPRPPRKRGAAARWAAGPATPGRSRCQTSLWCPWSWPCREGPASRMMRCSPAVTPLR